MKNLSIFKALTLFSAVILIQAFSSTEVKAAECTRTNGAIDGSNFTNNGVCQVTPDVAMFPLIKVGLCEEVPTYVNYLTSCKFLVEYTTAEEVQITKSTSIQLKNSLTLNEGTYKAAVLVIGNTIGVKHSDIFATTQNGNKFDTVEDEFTVAQGKYCSTRAYTGNQDMFDSANGGASEGEVETLESFLDCSTSASTAGLYKENKGAYLAEDNANPPNFILCDLDDNGVVIAPDALTTTNSTVGTVQICAMAANGTTPEQPGVQQLAIQTLPTAVKIDANTTTINVGFELTNMLQFEQHSAAGILNDTDVTVPFTNAFIESVGLKITTK